MKIFFLMTLLGSISLSVASGQTNQPVVSEMSGSEVIHDLANSALVIRLQMKKRTIDAYRNQVKNTEDLERKVRLQKDLDKLIEDRQNYKRVVMDAFRTHYLFSEVYFIHNHDYDEFHDEGKDMVFDASGNIVEWDTDKSYYLLIQGKTDLDWIIRDHNLNRLPADFPDQHGIGFKRVLNWAVGEDDANITDMANIAKKIDERLRRYKDKHN